VVDLDGEEGRNNFLALLQPHGFDLSTLTSCTGGGGYHLLFRHPGALIKNDTGKKLAAGIDIRGDGGYIVAPPSLHVSGNRYLWSAVDVPPAKLPEWLLQMMVAVPQVGLIEANGGRVIPEGQRNSSLLSLAGAMQRRGADQQSIASALLTENQQRCQPRLPEAEVRSIVSSITKYASVLESEHLTDLGNARRLVARHGSDMRFCQVWKAWLVWDGTLWKRDDTGEVERRAKETALSIYGEATVEPDADKRRLISKWARDSESHKHIAAMIDLAKSEIGILASPAQFDADPFLLNCRNGTLDLRTGVLLEHRREDFCTKQVACNYIPDAPCPAWSMFLNERLATSGWLNSSSERSAMP
jgi:putative DNA primase/helicase